MNPVRLIPAHPKRLTALLALLLLSACGGHGQDAAKPDSAPREISAPVDAATLSTLAFRHVAPASVESETQVKVASRLMGYIRAIEVVEGQSVRAGQPLFSIDPVDIQGQVDQARAAVQQAEVAERDAQVEYERFAALLKEEAVTRQQYEKMKLQHEIAATRVTQAKAALGTASHQLRYASVHAPIAGVVTQKLANTGDLAAPGQPVLVLENPGRLQVRAHVPESVFAGLRLGTLVTVEIDGQAQALTARVARLSPAADPVSRLFEVKLDVDAKGLRSGVFARALFPYGERQALSIPASALLTRAGIRGAFVLGADNRAEFRMLRVGETHGERVEVLAGLKAGERVVSGNSERIESGDKVVATSAAARAEASGG